MSARNNISNGAAPQGALSEKAISFAHRHTHSEAFKSLFREGMNLVEEAAGYLDGPGRSASKALRRPAALAYATESMRLTTRLMQIASWLLLRRAVNEGEITQAQALSERHRVRLTRQELSCDTVMLGELPADFTDLAERSLRLQARVMHLDRSLAEPQPAASAAADTPLAKQLARVEAAFRDH
jgi:regulator of CtrA degradation